MASPASGAPLMAGATSPPMQTPSPLQEGTPIWVQGQTDEWGNQPRMQGSEAYNFQRDVPELAATPFGGKWR